MSGRFVAIAIAITLGLAAIACDGATPSADAGADAGHAAHCTSAADCDDGMYCDGVETCRPGDPSADARGCVAGAAPCAMGEACDETRRTCTSCTMPDHDGDGLGAAACGGIDCDDADPARYPGHAETCDATTAMHDEDCDPCTLAGVEGDADHDGYPSSACTNAYEGAMPACDPRATRIDAVAHLVVGADCDDANASVHPSQPEVCNGVDDDCNGMIDDGVQLTFRRDADGDGFGDPSGASVMGCTAPSGYALDASDCDDTSAERSPRGVETCDGADDDCDGHIDEDASTTFYADRDADGWGDPAVSMPGASCAPPSGFVIRSGDCNDANAAVYPGAPELCDRVDDDCMPRAGAPGSAAPEEDADGDGHAPRSGLCAGGFPADDCDDTQGSRHPGAPETCDGADDDCDGDVDETAAADAFCGRGARCSAAVCTSLAGIAAGGAMGCAIAASGSVSCWGYAYDALYGGSRARSVPMTIPFIGDAVEVDAAAGDGFGALVSGGCARRATGEVACWDTAHDGSSLVTGVTRAVQLAMGGEHRCARRLDGTVLCWGGNTHGEVGSGNTEAAASPVTVVGLADVVDVAAGSQHTCAISRAGAVSCWGANAEGQLGDGTTIDRYVPTLVSGLPFADSVQLAAGLAHTCALSATGVVACWGRDLDGQLGDGTTTSSLAPVSVLGLADAVEIASAGAHTCARRASGALVCWGLGDHGALGDTTLASRSAPVAVSMPASDAIGLALGALDTGTISDGCASRVYRFDACGNHVDDDCNGLVDDGCGDFSCARRASGEVVCWGYGTLGQLGDGNYYHYVTRPEPIAVTPPGAVDVMTGESYGCAARPDGSVECWGATPLAPTDPLGWTTAVQVPGIVDATRVVAGGAACAVRATGEVACWGSDYFGQVGDGGSTSVTTATAVAGVSGALDVACGGEHCCALLSSGDVWCWGDDGCSQLGDGADPSSCWFSASLGRALAQPVPGLHDAVSIDAEAMLTCVVRAAGAGVACWGANDVIGAPTPTTLPSSVGATEVAVGGGHLCWITPSTTVECLGAASYGQIGDGALGDYRSAATPVGLVGVTEVVAGSFTTCALASSGVYCWGFAGEVGDGSAQVQPVPVPIAGFPSPVQHLVSSGERTCAMLADGSAYCWGENHFGATGNGSLDADAVRPHTVLGLP